MTWILVLCLAAIVTYATRIGGLFMLSWKCPQRIIQKFAPYVAPVAFLCLILSDSVERVQADGWVAVSLAVGSLIAIYMRTRWFLSAILLSTFVYLIVGVLR